MHATTRILTFFNLENKPENSIEGVFQNAGIPIQNKGIQILPALIKIH